MSPLVWYPHIELELARLKILAKTSANIRSDGRCITFGWWIFMFHSNAGTAAMARQLTINFLLFSFTLLLLFIRLFRSHRVAYCCTTQYICPVDHWYLGKLSIYSLYSRCCPSPSLLLGVRAVYLFGLHVFIACSVWSKFQL